MPGALAAQTIPAGEYAARRDSLAARIDSGIVVAFGGRTPGLARFQQLPAFRYLTGFLEPDAALVMVVAARRRRVARFHRRRATRAARSTTAFRPIRPRSPGAPASRPAPSAHSRRSSTRWPSGLPFYTLADFATADAAETDSLTRGAHYMRQFAEGHPSLTVRDGHPILDSLRTRKSPAELAMLRRAIDITSAAACAR